MNKLIPLVSSILLYSSASKANYIDLVDIFPYQINNIISSNNSEKEYDVISVSDGDTIKINYNGEEKSIRLIGVDTPEKFTLRFGYKECYGDESSLYLEKLLKGKKVSLEFDPSQGKFDKYGRLLAYIIYDGKNINGKLILEGYGWENTYKNPYKYMKEFKAYQEIADKNDRGLWSPDTCDGKRTKKFNAQERTLNFVNDILKGVHPDCGNKKYCNQMDDCKEAKFYLDECDIKSLDRDKDGVPCETICRD